MKIYTNELYHHGILGQKWGKCNGPPYPLKSSAHSSSEEKAGWKKSLNKQEDYYRESSKQVKTLNNGTKQFPKGFVFNRVGKNTSEIRTNETGGLYVSYGKADASRYVKIYGPDLVNTLFRNTREAVQHISVISPLNMASDSQTVSETGKFLKANPEITKSFSESVFTQTHLDKETNKLIEKNIDQMIENPDSLSSQQMAFVINMHLVMSDFYKDEIKAYYDHFRNAGFDAIPDLHDRWDGTSETAMIIVNPKKVQVTETTALTRDVYNVAKDYVNAVGKVPVSDVYRKI